MKEEGSAMSGPRGSDEQPDLAVRQWQGTSLTYRVGTTDEFLFDDSYGETRFFPPGFEVGRAGTIIDAGAHIGAFTVLAARQVPDGTVHALEPGSANVALLERNAAANGAANVHAHQLALGGADGTVRLYQAPGSIGHSLYRNPGWDDVVPEPGIDRESRDYEEVECVTLERFLRANAIEAVDLLKMNIEGAEYDILRGTCVEVLRRIRWMQIELHPVQDAVAEAALARLREAGFEVTTISTDHPDVRGWATARLTPG